MRGLSRPAVLLAGGATAVALAVPPGAAAPTWERSVIGTPVTDRGYVIPTATDGELVVGRASAPPMDDDEGLFQAFAQPVDGDGPVRLLGTLGGEWSEALDVDGGIVVGAARTGHWTTNAFYVDLAAETPTMVGLGTLGGATSVARKVEDGVIVGVSENVDGDQRPFRYDLNAEEPVLEELPIGGWRGASVVDIHDGIVVGVLRGQGKRHAYALDLDRPTPRLHDLGTLGDRVVVEDVHDGVVVGSSSYRGERFYRPFFYDLDRPRKGMQVVARHWGRGGALLATNGRKVVGIVYLKGNRERLFVADTRAPRRTRTAITPKRWGSFWDVSVTGRWLVGTSPMGARVSTTFVADLAARKPRPRLLERGLTWPVAHSRWVVGQGRGEKPEEGRASRALVAWERVSR